jgi:hypothetical protein
MIPFSDRILCSFDDAAEATGLSKRKIYQLLPQIESRKSAADGCLSLARSSNT